MNITTCKNCNAINMQGCENCHNCNHMLFKRLPSSNNYEIMGGRVLVTHESHKLGYMGSNPVPPTN